MWQFVLISTLVAGASAGYASSQYAGAGTSSGGVYNHVSTGQNAYADKYPYFNTGFNGAGYTQNFAGPNGFGAAAGAGSFAGPGFAAPFQPFANPFDFNSFYQGLQSNFANLYQQQLAHQNALFNSIRQQQAAFASNAANYGPGAGGNYGAGSGYAGASASYGPGGVHQAAHIYPENPASPNVVTSNRFGGDSAQAGQGGPGFVGVSSFSSSSNINGQSHREASTTVNDNGKVTTYHVRS